MKGTLAQKNFPRLLCGLWQDRVTGTLCLQRRLVEKKIHFKQGVIVHASSNLLHETTAAYLVKVGKINEQQQEDALEKARQQRKRIGEALIELGFIDVRDFYDSLRKNLIEKILDCFVWKDGNYEFDDSEGPFENQLALNVDPFRVLIQGIHTVMPFQRMRDDIGLVLNKPTRVASAQLPTWADGYLNTMSLKLLKAFQEPIKPRFVMQDLNIEEEVMLRIVYAFDVTGLIMNTEEKLSEEKPQKEKVIEAPVCSPTTGFGLDAEQTDQLRDDVLALSLRLDQVTHFELLGVEESATVTAIHIAFVKFLERFSLVYFLQGELAEYRDQVENLILAAAEAYADLRNATAKTNYLDKLKAKRAQKDANKKKPGEAFKISTQLLDAKSQFKQGLQHLNQRNFKKAVEFFEYTCDIDGREPLYTAHLAWAKYQHDSEMHELEATEMFETAIKSGSHHPTINMLYGKFLVSQGEAKKGLNYLKKASQLSPKDLEIQRAFRITKGEVEKRG